MGTNFSLEGNTKDYRFSYILGHDINRTNS